MKGFEIWLSNIWKDPVWSKVISVGIIGIITILYAIVSSLLKKISIEESLLELVKFKVNAMLVIASLGIYSLVRSFMKRKIYNSKQTKIRAFNKSHFDNQGILVKWNVYFGDGGIPFISNMNMFCLRHGDLPLKFLYDKCQVNDCQNHIHHPSYPHMENYITSIVINEWEKLNGANN